MTKHADAEVSVAPLRLWLDYEFAISSCLVVFTSTNISIRQQKLLVFCIRLFLLNCALKHYETDAELLRHQIEIVFSDVS